MKFCKTVPEVNGSLKEVIQKRNVEAILSGRRQRRKEQAHRVNKVSRNGNSEPCDVEGIGLALM